MFFTGEMQLKYSLDYPVYNYQKTNYTKIVLKLNN